MSDKIGRSIARPASTDDQVDYDPSTPIFAQNYPSLYRLLAEKRENEKFHASGCLTVFWEDGVFKVSINDRPNGKSCFVSARELGEALLIADRGLRSGTLKWRANRRYVAQARALFK